MLTLASIGQNTSRSNQETTTLDLDNSNISHLFSALLSEDSCKVLLEFSLKDGLHKHSHNYIIDLNSNSIQSEFQYHKWTYLHQSYFYNDSLLYLSYGRRLNTKYLIIHLDSGQVRGKVKDVSSPKGRGYKSEQLEIKNVFMYSEEELKKLSIPYVNEDRFELKNVIIQFNPDKGFLLLIKK